MISVHHRQFFIFADYYLNILMQKSTIVVDIELDENKVPENIFWNASESTAQNKQRAKAMMLAFWDGIDKSALRIDLWTKDMMVDEMGDFFYQTIFAMADTLMRSSRQEELSKEMKNFAKSFYAKFREAQLKENKLT